MADAANPLNFPFTARELTQHIAGRAPVFGDILKSGMFKPKPVTTSEFVLTRTDQEIVVLSSGAADERRSVLADQETSATILTAAKFTHQVKITPRDLQDNVWLDAGGQKLTSVDMAVNDRLDVLGLTFDQTQEYLVATALNGVVKAGDNGALYNLYNLMGVTQKVIDLDLGNPEADILNKLRQAETHIRKNIRGEPVDGFAALVGGGLLDRIRVHPSVRRYFEGYANPFNANPGAEEELKIGKVRFRDYFAFAKNSMGEDLEYIPDDGGFLWPTGTRNLFSYYFTPVDQIDRANKMPDGKVVITLEALPHNKGFEIQGEINCIPVVSQPAAVVKLTSST